MDECKYRETPCTECKKGVTADMMALSSLFINTASHPRCSVCVRSIADECLALVMKSNAKILGNMSQVESENALGKLAEFEAQTGISLNMTRAVIREYSE